MEPNKLTEYDLYMEAQRNIIIGMKVLELGRIDIQIGTEVVHIMSYNSITNETDILYYDKPNEIPITEEIIINKLRRVYPSIEYIYFDGIYLDSESVYTQESMQLYLKTVELLNVCKYKAEEFTEYINYNLLDYLLEMSHEN